MLFLTFVTVTIIYRENFRRSILAFLFQTNLVELRILCQKDFYLKGTKIFLSLNRCFWWVTMQLYHSFQNVKILAKQLNMMNWEVLSRILLRLLLRILLCSKTWLWNICVQVSVQEIKKLNLPLKKAFKMLKDKTFNVFDKCIKYFCSHFSVMSKHVEHYGI